MPKKILAAVAELERFQLAHLSPSRLLAREGNRDLMLISRDEFGNAVVHAVDARYLAMASAISKARIPFATIGRLDDDSAARGATRAKRIASGD